MTRVMLIEDDVDMLPLLRTLLQLEGYEVVATGTAGSQDDFLAEVRAARPALILLDVHLRHLSGFDLLKAIRQDPILQPVRVLMSSGMEVQGRCLEAGADDFLLKPYMPDELVFKIRQLVRSDA